MWKTLYLDFIQFQSIKFQGKLKIWIYQDFHLINIVRLKIYQVEHRDICIHLNSYKVQFTQYIYPGDLAQTLLTVFSKNKKWTLILLGNYPWLWVSILLTGVREHIKQPNFGTEKPHIYHRKAMHSQRITV